VVTVPGELSASADDASLMPFAADEHGKVLSFQWAVVVARPADSMAEKIECSAGSVFGGQFFTVESGGAAEPQDSFSGGRGSCRAANPSGGRGSCRAANLHGQRWQIGGTFARPTRGGAGRRGQFPGRIGFLPEMATLSRSGPYDYNPETPPRRHSSQFVMTLSVVPHAQPASAYSIARGTTLGGFVAGMVSPDTDRTDA